MKLKNALHRIEPVLDGIEKAVLSINVVILFLIAVVICVQVFARFMLIPLAGTEELCQYSYVVFVFLAWSLAALRGTDVSVRLVFDKFPYKVRQILLGVYHVIMAGFTGMVLKSCLLNMANSANVRSPNNPWFMMGWLYCGACVGIVMTIIFNLIRAMRLWTQIDIYETEEQVNQRMIAEAIAANEAAE